MFCKVLSLCLSMYLVLWIYLQSGISVHSIYNGLSATRFNMSPNMELLLTVPAPVHFDFNIQILTGTWHYWRLLGLSELSLHIFSVI